jgi:hypothetical protein
MNRFTFAKKTYITLIKSAIESGFEFISFNEAKAKSTQMGKHLLLRHDVDVSMEYAYEMAKIEAALRVKSTYFVMLRSPMYNLFSRHASACLRKIIELGHGIGVHYDASYTQGSEKEFKEWLQFEIRILSEMSGVAVDAFSFHQPSQFIIDKQISLNGLINTYNTTQISGYKYISDSNRVWKELDPFSALQSYDKVQLLIHPIWWICEEENIENCWDETIKLNFNLMQQQLLETERAYGKYREIRLQKIR